MASRSNTLLRMLQCATAAGVDYNAIEGCAEGREGDELLAAMGNRTLYFTPQITFVPTVAINGVSTFVTSVYSKELT